MLENYPVLSDILTVTIAIIVAVATHLIVYKLVCSAFKRSEGWVKKTLTRLKLPLFLTFVIVALKVVVPMLALKQKYAGTISHTLSLLGILTICVLLVKVLSIITDVVLWKFDISQKNNLQARKIHTQFGVLRRILTFVIVVLGIGVALMTFEKVREIGVSLLASAGIAGIIVGFAAQKIIATILAGFQIALTQPIRLDDVVIVEGEWGRIEEIHLTYVVVLIWDKRRLVVPTTYFIEKPFQNWTRKSSDLLGTVFIYADYDVSFDALRKELTRILEANELWDGKVNVLQVTDATEKSVQIRALMSASDSSSAWDLRVHVREKLIEFLQKEYPESVPRERIFLRQDMLQPEGNGKGNASQ